MHEDAFRGHRVESTELLSRPRPAGKHLIHRGDQPMGSGPKHRRATTWLHDGKSPVLVRRAMGHSDLATTMGYAHLVDDDLLAPGSR